TLTLNESFKKYSKATKLPTALTNNLPAFESVLKVRVQKEKRTGRLSSQRPVHRSFASRGSLVCSDFCARHRTWAPLTEAPLFDVSFLPDFLNKLLKYIMTIMEKIIRFTKN